MARGNRATCRCCGKHKSEVGEISWAGYCGTCGPAIREAQNDDMHYHRGPYLLQWRRATATSVGAILLEDLEAYLASRTPNV